MLDSILNVIIWRGRLFHQKQNLIILTSMAEEIVWCYLSFLMLWKIKTQKAQCHQYFQKLMSLLGHSMSRLATGLVYLAKVSPEKQSLDQSNAGIPKKLYSIGRNYAKYNFDGRTKIFVNENLSPANESIAYNNRKLWQAKIIDSCYSRDGINCIKNTVNSKPEKIYDIKGLRDLFPDFFFQMMKKKHTTW